jgi:hypothetical protein
MSIGLGVRLAVTVTVAVGREMLLDFVVELVVVAIVVEKESVAVEWAVGREVELESEFEVEESVLIVVDKVLVEDCDWESVDAIVFVFVCVFEADRVESVFVKEGNGPEMLKSKADVEAAKRRKARGEVDFILN